MLRSHRGQAGLCWSLVSVMSGCGTFACKLAFTYRCISLFAFVFSFSCLVNISTGKPRLRRTKRKSSVHTQASLAKEGRGSPRGWSWSTWPQLLLQLALRGVCWGPREHGGQSCTLSEGCSVDRAPGLLSLLLQLSALLLCTVTALVTYMSVYLTPCQPVIVILVSPAPVWCVICNEGSRMKPNGGH